MFALIFTMLLREPAPLWRIDTEVFRPLQRAEALVRPDGAVYVADRAGVQIALYDARGKFLKHIGKRGMGPGEFDHITRIFFRKGLLYVHDNGRDLAHVFDADGHLLRALAVPKRRATLVLAAGGWLVGDWNRVGAGGGATVYWADTSLENLRELTRFDADLYHHGSRATRARPDVALFTPFSNKPKTAVTEDGRRVYLTAPNDFRILIFDGENGQSLGEIKRVEPRVPMDWEWIQAEMAEFRLDVGDMSLRLEAHAPDYFPAIRDLMLDDQGFLVVDRWRGRPEKRRHPLRLTPDGKEAEMVSSWSLLSRLAGVEDGFAFLTGFDKDREAAYLVKIRQEDLKAWRLAMARDAADQ